MGLGGAAMAYGMVRELYSSTNVKGGEVTQDREVTHTATVAKKSDHSTNSQPNWIKQDDIN